MDSVSFNDVLFGDFTEVVNRVRDVTLEYVVFCGGV